jgi:hypothetical protein
MVWFSILNNLREKKQNLEKTKEIHGKNEDGLNEDLMELNNHNKTYSKSHLNNDKNKTNGEIKMLKTRISSKRKEKSIQKQLDFLNNLVFFIFLSFFIVLNFFFLLIIPYLAEKAETIIS